MRPVVRAAGALLAPAARGAARLRRSRPLTLVGWHRIGDADDGLTTTLADFRAHLDVLAAWGAMVLPLTEAHDRLQAGTLPARAVALTFDDGYASVLEEAWPELRRRGLPATLYAVSDYLDPDARFPWDHRHEPDSELVRLCSADALVAAADEGLDVGSHTATHRWLPSLSATEVAEELARSRDDLGDLLGRRVRSFAYPMGGWTPAIRDQVEQAGYDLAITVDRGANTRGHDAIALRRAFAFDRATDVRRQLDGGYTWMRAVERRRSRREPTW